MESKPVAVVWDGDNPIHESVIQLPIDDNIIAGMSVISSNTSLQDLNIYSSSTPDRNSQGLAPRT